jgi:hypothetical protein
MVKIREIASIILFGVVLLIASIIHAEASLDKQLLAEEQLGRLNQLYKGFDTFCEGKNFHADLIIECKLQKAKIKSEFASRIDLLIYKKLEDGKAKIEADILEEKCLSRARERAESLNVAYLVGDNCYQVNAKISSAQGSGSGGQ